MEKWNDIIVITLKIKQLIQSKLFWYIM